MNLLKLDNKDVAKLLLPLQHIEKRDIISLKPSRDAENTKEEMKTFLQRHHGSGRVIGFEMNYEGDSTTFNLVTEKYKHKQTEQRFNAFHDEDGEMTIANSKFIDGVADNKYMTFYDFKLREDYWHPITRYTELQERDPLDEILTEMAGRDHNIEFKYQIIAQPIEKNRWNNRFPIPWLVSGLLGDVTSSIYYLFASVLSMFELLDSDNKSGAKDSGEDFIDYFNKAFFGLLKSPFQWLNGLSDSEYKNKLISDEQMKDDIQSKNNEQGYVCNIRLIAIGDDKEEVSEYTGEVVDRIEKLYTRTDSTIPSNQGLKAVQKNNSQWMLTEAARMVNRDTDLDFNRRLLNKEWLYYLRRSRTKPTILTPSEMASLMHVISDSKHPSIEYEA
jgi:hypothetical protein